MGTAQISDKTMKLVVAQVVSEVPGSCKNEKHTREKRALRVVKVSQSRQTKDGHQSKSGAMQQFMCPKQMH